MSSPAGPHPDFPEPQNRIEPCPACGEVPDFTTMPRGLYAYVGLPDGRAACQLAQPLDPMIIPYLKGPILAHVCRQPPAKAVVDAAEAITKIAAPS